MIYGLAENAAKFAHEPKSAFKAEKRAYGAGD
jgi:hypothetical protein